LILEEITRLTKFYYVLIDFCSVVFGLNFQNCRNLVVFFLTPKIVKHKMNQRFFAEQENLQQSTCEWKYKKMRKLFEPERTGHKRFTKKKHYTKLLSINQQNLLLYNLRETAKQPWEEKKERKKQKNLKRTLFLDRVYELHVKITILNVSYPPIACLCITCMFDGVAGRSPK
jgi:hypothetical protein